MIYYHLVSQQLLSQVTNYDQMYPVAGDLISFRLIKSRLLFEYFPNFGDIQCSLGSFTALTAWTVHWETWI